MNQGRTISADRRRENQRSADEHCSQDGCDATIPGRAWGYIKSGWFFQKNGSQYCPEYTPEWVAEWRARKKRDNPEKEG